MCKPKSNIWNISTCFSKITVENESSAIYKESCTKFNDYWKLFSELTFDTNIFWHVANIVNVIIKGEFVRKIVSLASCTRMRRSKSSGGDETDDWKKKKMPICMRLKYSLYTHTYSKACVWVWRLTYYTLKIASLTIWLAVLQKWYQVE